MSRSHDAEGTIRCGHRIFGIFRHDGDHAGLLEVQCPTKKCKNGEKVVVFHYFDVQTGVLKDTVRYREPAALFATNRKDEVS